MRECVRARSYCCSVDGLHESAGHVFTLYSSGSVVLSPVQQHSLQPQGRQWETEGERDRGREIEGEGDRGTEGDRDRQQETERDRGRQTQSGQRETETERDRGRQRQRGQRETERDRGRQRQEGHEVLLNNQGPHVRSLLTQKKLRKYLFTQTTGCTKILHGKVWISMQTSGLAYRHLSFCQLATVLQNASSTLLNSIMYAVY